MTMEKRLDHDADTPAAIRQYYQTRALQLAHAGFIWNGELKEEKFGFSTLFHKWGQAYRSAYVLASRRKQGLYREWLGESSNSSEPVITVNSCKLEPYFQKIGFTNFMVPGIPEDWIEYKLIEKSYGDGRAKRSHMFFMNHIDEGLLLLKKIGADITTQKAFCLHPLVQDDSSLQENFHTIHWKIVDPAALVLAMEYRQVANAYLARRRISSPKEIKLPCLPQVTQMLVADKVQNYKDFLLYQHNHPNHYQLQNYFENWCTALKCRQLVDMARLDPLGLAALGEPRPLSAAEKVSRFGKNIQTIQPSVQAVAAAKTSP